MRRVLKWQPGAVCPVGKLCDSSSGECATIVPECATVKPGDSMCRGDVAFKCGPDLVTTDAGTPCVLLVRQWRFAKRPPPVVTKKSKSVKIATTTTRLRVMVAVRPAAGSPSRFPLANRHRARFQRWASVKCWGENQFGQLGQGNTASHRSAEPPNDIANTKPIDLGSGRTASPLLSVRTTCALLDNKTVKCWGSNSAGQLGQGDLQDRGAKPGELGDNLPPVILGDDALWRDDRWFSRLRHPLAWRRQVLGRRYGRAARL